MRTSDFDYHLPPELIAQTPVEPRDSSRLLALHRKTGRLEHRAFTSLLEYLRPGDLMVFNRSRVLPARLFGVRAENGGKVELLLLRRQAPGVWQSLARPGRRLRPGEVIAMLPNAAAPPIKELTAEVLESHQDGTKSVRLSDEDALPWFGHTPLPPYIHRKLDDPERYQTVYAKEPGSAAAPTAGLHFTRAMLDRVEAAGVETAFVTLHVGLDTFRPVESDDPLEHKIHTEHYEIGDAAAGALRRARAESRRIVAIGTTTARVLEQAAQDADGAFEATEGEAFIYILPGHQFLAVDAMLTNFHLPRSSLLMMLSAFAEQHGQPDSGRKLMLRAYEEAISQRYRFYSFGDAMLVL